uniref:Uncharacterized protein n=1 Tax=Panagrolaimus sp. JU765 TaxID=591449 RepID=A0AC34QR94_9BILA
MKDGSKKKKIDDGRNAHDAVIAEIKTERHKLRTKKDNIKKFLEEKTDYFWKLVVFFQKLVTEMLADPLKCENKRFQALDELIKILTICCVNSVVSEKSTPTLLFGECRFSPIPQLLTRILESGERIPTNSKVLLLGLIAGFSTRNKGVAMLAGTPLLVDRIALCLTSEDESIRNAAVSTVIVLSKHAKFLKVGFYLHFKRKKIGMSKWDKQNHIFNNQIRT